EGIKRGRGVYPPPLPRATRRGLILHPAAAPDYLRPLPPLVPPLFFELLFFELLFFELLFFELLFFELPFFEPPLLAPALPAPPFFAAAFFAAPFLAAEVPPAAFFDP